MLRLSIAIAMAFLTAFADDKLPIVFQEDFEHGAQRWEPLDKGQWQLKEVEGGGHVYSQFKKETKAKPPHRSPTNVAIEKDVSVGEMEFTGRVRSTHPDYGHRDAVVVFGYQDPAH